MSLGLALGGASLLGNIYGNYKSAQHNKEIDDILSTRQSDLQNQYDKDINTNFLDTDQARATLKILSNQHDKANKRIDGASVVTGGSAEKVIAAKGESQGKFDEAITRLAGYGTQYADMKERNFNRRNDSLNNIFLQHEVNKGQNSMNFMNNATNLGQSAIMADVLGKKKTA